MLFTNAIQSFHLLGEEIRGFLEGKSEQPQEWEQALHLAEQENAWFTKDNIRQALKGISSWLDKDILDKWASTYPKLTIENKKPLTIGIVMAGNIPLVGFHDFLCVLLSGNILYAKLSHSDARLLPFLAKKLTEIEPGWGERIKFVEKLTGSIDAVIATGSNNTARHFEYYFRDIPHIIRKNRNGIAILNGSETTEELFALGSDIFSYFGLGCRNVSKLYVPSGYIFDDFFRSVEPYKDIINHNKYHSNYVYNRTIYLMDGKKFTDNGFLAVINSPASSSPIAVLNFEEYDNIEKLTTHLADIKEQIQCIAVSTEVKDGVLKHDQPLPFVTIGTTQSPSLFDYPDGVDIMKFCLSLS